MYFKASSTLFVIAAVLAAVISAVPVYETFIDEDGAEYALVRVPRSVQPGAPNIPTPGNNNPWEVSPNVARGEDGNTRATLGVKHTGPNHEVGGQWSKVVHGHKSKPTWSVGGTFKW